METIISSTLKQPSDEGTLSYLTNRCFLLQKYYYSGSRRVPFLPTCIPGHWISSSVVLHLSKASATTSTQHATKSLIKMNMLRAARIVFVGLSPSWSCSFRAQGDLVCSKKPSNLSPRRIFDPRENFSAKWANLEHYRGKLKCLILKLISIFINANRNICRGRAVGMYVCVCVYVFVTYEFIEQLSTRSN